MATNKKAAYLKVLTPLTEDGLNLVLDEKEAKQYKETTVPITAKPHFESLNAKLPDTLKHKLIELDADGNEIKAETTSGKKNSNQSE